ncbi:MAG TPA: PLP-dependent aminotransferase family protein [Gaiellaceae bacterium]|nr:PLP-dependent aminotransferase family protein [Gaiellaceae bacterium]
MDTISLARGFPSPDLLPLEELADCAETVVAREGRTILSYGSGAGYTPLRELIGEWFGVHPGRVVLTNGSLQGLWLLARREVRGRNVMVEWPTYDRALTLLLDAGAQLLAAVVDSDGVDPDNVGVTLMGQMTPAFLYTIPTFHNPTGTVLPLERRRELLRVAASRQMLVVEDDPYGLVRFEGEPLPALFDLSGKETVYLSSFSKTIAPGVRVGFMILPERLADEVATAAADAYITPVQLGQAVAHEFIRRGSFVENLKRVNEQLGLRRDAMLAALEKHFAGARWSRPQGGYFVWLELPVPTDSREVLARAEGVTAVDGTAFSAPANFLRLAYSYAAPDEIEAGVERLAAAV